MFFLLTKFNQKLSMIYAIKNTFKNSFYFSFIFISILYFFNIGQNYTDYILPFMILNIGSFLGLWIYESEENQIITINSKTKRKQKLIYKHGLLHGEYMEWYENGNLFLKRKYVYGKLEGKSIHCDDNGKVRMQSYFKDDKLHGKSISWYDNFKVIDYYKYDIPNGPYLVFDKWGNKLLSNFYVDGELDGWSYQYSDHPEMKNHLILESFFKRGKAHGLYIRYLGFRHYNIGFFINGELGKMLSGKDCFSEFYREDKDCKKWIELRKNLISLGIEKEHLYKFDSLKNYDEVLRKKFPDITNHNIKQIIKDSLIQDKKIKNYMN